MNMKFWLARAKKGRTDRQLELYAGAAPPICNEGHWDTRGRCRFIGPIDPVVCSGFSVEPGECIQAEIGLMQRAEEGEVERR